VWRARVPGTSEATLLTASLTTFNTGLSRRGFVFNLAHRGFRYRVAAAGAVNLQRIPWCLVPARQQGDVSDSGRNQLFEAARSIEGVCKASLAGWATGCRTAVTCVNESNIGRLLYI
jgi:hypothetical protein